VASGTVVDRPVVEDRVIDRPGEFQVQHTERANYGKASREQEQIDARPPARGWSLGPILLVVLATTFAIQALITAPLILHAMSDRDGQFLYNLQNAPIIGPFVLYWGILGPLNALAPDWGVGMSLSEAMRVVFFVALGHLLLAAGCFRLAYRAAHRPS
jgi:hypothetical protein